MRTLTILSLAALATAARAFAPATGPRSLPIAAAARRSAVAPLAASPIDNLFALLKGGKVGLVKSLAGEYDAAAVRAKMDSLVESSPVLMLSFVTWPFCIKAKELLDAKGAKYTVVELDQESDGKAIRAEMGDMLGRTSVPAIWIQGEFIGGCNDGPAQYGGINTLDSAGKLDGMLKAAGAL